MRSGFAFTPTSVISESVSLTFAFLISRALGRKQTPPTALKFTASGRHPGFLSKSLSPNFQLLVKTLHGAVGTWDISGPVTCARTQERVVYTCAPEVHKRIKVGKAQSPAEASQCVSMYECGSVCVCECEYVCV